jgi:hypothetical protein
MSEMRTRRAVASMLVTILIAPAIEFILAPDLLRLIV